MAFFILSQILTVRTLPVPGSKGGTEAAEKITDRCLLEEDNISDVTSPWTSEVLFEKHLELQKFYSETIRVDLRANTAWLSLTPSIVREDGLDLELQEVDCWG